MWRWIGIGTLALGGSAFAQSKPTTCPLTHEQTNCVRVLACYGTQGMWFHGRSFGRGEGTLAGLRSDGAACAGTWTARNAFGLGQADVACDDGDTVTVIYTYQEEYTGTAIGYGRSASGQMVQAWSGLHVLDHLRDSGMPDGTLLCGPTSIPMS